MRNYCVAFTILMFSISAYAQDVCTPPVRTTKYKISKGEYPAAVLRKFGLEPFGRSGAMKEFLKINNLKNPDLVEPGTYFSLPFKCEEQVTKYTVVNESDYRVITFALADKENKNDNVQDNKKITVDFTQPAAPPVASDVAAAVAAADSSDSNKENKDEKLSEIVTAQVKENERVPTPEQEDIEAQKSKESSQDNISEALRYRMICEGEWTGSECISRYTAIYTTFGGYNNRYDGVDSNALPGAQKDGLLLSKLNPAVGFGGHNYWNENVRTTLYLELQQNSMLPDIKSVPIENGDRLLTSLSGEVRYEKGAWGIGLGFKQFDKLYYVFNFDNLVMGSICTAADVSKCGVIVYSANVSSFFVDLSYMIHQEGKFRFDTEFKYFTLAGTKVSNVDVYSGSGQSIELSVTHDRVKEYLKGTLRYAMSTQDTSIETQNAKELSLMFAYSWKLKDWSTESLFGD